MAKGAVIQDEAEFYIALSFSLASSVSTQISALRYQLFESSLKLGFMYALARYLSSFIFFSFLIFLISYQGEIPLFVNVESADIMAALVNL